MSIKRAARVAVSLVWIMAGCSGMRPAAHPAVPADLPAAAPAAAPESPAPPADSDSNPSEANNDAAAPNASAAAAVVCVPPETKPKPKTRRKPKAVLKEAPPQPQTAPVVAENPGALIDAEVRAMPVSVMSILGKKVQGPKGEDVGRVVDVLADSSGRVRTAIIDFGGFLGVGNHRIAVDWPLLRFNPDAREPTLLLNINPDKLRTAPEYKDNPRPQILMVPSAPAPSPPPAEGKM